MDSVAVVPVKISERFKPPPKIILPQSIVQRLNTTRDLAQTAEYDFTLECNVLAKISEWRAVRQREKCERHERIRIAEERRIKQVEEKQKQMLNDVSYPSAEDLSIEEETETPAVKLPQIIASPQSQFYATVFDTILTPTVVPGLLNHQNGLDSFSSTRYSSNYHANKMKINYSDFENDTSSPFDNMELKTINDLDILAQVLNNTITIDSKTKDNYPTAIATQTNASHSDHNITTITQETNDNILHTNDIQETASAIPQSNLASSNQTNNYYNSHHPFEINQYQQPIYTTTASNNIGYQNTYYNPINFQLATNTYSIPEQITNSVKSKSKSVPDILKELNDNINDSEMRRIRNNSQTIASDSNFPEESENDLKAEAEEATNIILSISSEHLAKNISTMGFPIARVARVVQLIGSDDKKIIDHLIVLTELLDLGFEESIISNALIKFENNKDKALDFLIS